MMLTMISSLVVLVITGIVLPKQAQKELFRHMNRDIPSQAMSIRADIDSYLGGITRSLNLASGTDALQRLVLEADSLGAGARFETSSAFPTAVSELSHAYQKMPSGAPNLFVAYGTNNQFLQHTGDYSAPGFTLTDRPWWKQLEASGGKPIVTATYEATVPSKMVVTIVVPSMRDSTLVGAVGSDVTLDVMSEILSSVSLGETSYPVVYDGAGNIIYHPDSEALLSNVADTNYAPELKDAIQNGKNLDTVPHYAFGAGSRPTGRRCI